MSIKQIWCAITALSAAVVGCGGEDLDVGEQVEPSASKIPWSAEDRLAFVQADFDARVADLRAQQVNGAVRKAFAPNCPSNGVALSSHLDQPTRVLEHQVMATCMKDGVFYAAYLMDFDFNDDEIVGNDDGIFGLGSSRQFGTFDVTVLHNGDTNNLKARAYVLGPGSDGSCVFPVDTPRGEDRAVRTFFYPGDSTTDPSKCSPVAGISITAMNQTTPR